MIRLAIFSPNRNQYSETFIRMQIGELPFEIRVFSDGYFPASVSEDKGNTFRPLRKLKWWQKDHPVGRLKNELMDFKPQAILAQYGLTGVEIMAVARELRIPFIVHFHGFDAYRDDVLKDYTDRYRILFDNAAACVSVSRDMTSQLKKLGCPEEKVHYIPYGVDVPPLRVYGERENFFLACGRFVEKKAPLSTIQAFAKVHVGHSSWKLIMLGDGPLLKEAQKRVEESGLKDSVVFKGAVSHDEVWEHMSRAFAFVQHSVHPENNDSEGTPLAVLEAAAAGLPVISTFHGGIPDVVKEGVSGILCKEGDIDAMALAMEKLIGQPGMAHEMGTHGHAFVRDHFSRTAYISGLEKLIQTVVQKKQS